MMSGPGMFAMMLWMPIGILLCVILVAVAIWLLAGFLNRKQMPTLPYAPPRQDAYYIYEQGYQPQQRETGSSQEGGQQYPYPQPQYEQPQVQYPQEQETAWQR